MMVDIMMMFIVVSPIKMTTLEGSREHNRPGSRLHQDGPHVEYILVSDYMLSGQSSPQKCAAQAAPNRPILHKECILKRFML